MSYQNLLNAIARAELAGQTFKFVASSMDDSIIIEGNQLFTLSYRVNERLNAMIPELRGDDGVSVSSVSNVERDIIITFSDGTTNTFSDIYPEEPASIVNFYVETNGDLVQETNEGTIVVGNILPDEARGISDAEVLPNGDILFSFNDGTTRQIGNISEFGDPPISNTQIIDNNLFVEFGNGNSKNVGMVQGEQGFTAPEFSSVAQVRTGAETIYFDFTMSDGTTFRAGPARFEYRVATPEDSLKSSFDEETGELILFPPGVPSINLGSMHGIDGVDATDGITIETAEITNDGQEVYVTLTGQGRTKVDGTPKQIIIPAGDTEILSYQITDSRELVFEIGIPDNPPVKINVGRVRGSDGITIDAITILSNGDIQVTVNNDGRVRDTIIGNVAYEEITNAEILPTRELVFTTNKNNTIIADGSPDGMDGELGTFIQEIEYDPNNEMMASVLLTNDTRINDIGKVRPFKSHTVQRVNDEIIFNFDDGDTKNLGTIDGVDGKNANSVMYNNDTLTIGFDDSTNIDATGSINNVTTLTYNNDQLTFDYNEYTHTIDVPAQYHGQDGVWLTELRELSNGRVRAYFSDETYQTLNGGTIHGNWISFIDFVDIEGTNDVGIYVKYYNDDENIEPVNIATIHQFYGIDGNFITNMFYTENGDLTIVWNDQTVDVFGSLIPVWIEDVYLDGDNFIVKYNHLEEPVTIATVDGFNGVDGRWITNWRISTLSRNLLVTWNDSEEEENLGSIDGIQGNWITDIYRNDDKMLVTVDRYSNEVIQGDFSQIDGIEPRWITSSIINDNRQLEVQFNNEDTPTIIGSVDGVDGKVLSDMQIDGNRQLVLGYITSPDENLGDVDGLDGIILEDILIDDTTRDLTIVLSDRVENKGNIDGVNGIVPVNMYRNANGEFEVEYLDGTITTYDNIDGVNGIVPVNMYRNANGEFEVEYLDGTITTYDNIDGVNGIVPVNMYRNANGEFEVEYLDGTITAYDNIDGVDFVNEITNISEQNGTINVTITDGSVYQSPVIVRRFNDAMVVDDILSLSTNYLPDNIVVGNNAGLDVLDGVYATNIEVENQELFLDLSDSTRISAGIFNRVDFESASLVDGIDTELENLQITTTDNTVYDLGRVKGFGGSVNIVDGIINIEGKLVLTFSDDRTTTTDDRVQGVHGLDIVSSDITTEGFLIFNMSDSSIVEAGFVLQDLGFAPFDFVREYNRGESCTNDGQIYVALDNGVTSIPTPENSQWARVRLEGDSFYPEASRPELISPKDNEPHQFSQPYLLAGKLRNYYSVDTRGDRIFQIDLVGNNFTNPIYEATENLDGHQVNMDLTIGTEYKWRCRDIVKETGYITDWSLEGTFTVVANVVERPTVTLGVGMDVNAMPAMPVFDGSVFNGSGSHLESTWQIKRNDTDEIVYDYRGTDLVNTIIPFGVLVEDTDYSVRVQHHGSEGDSPYSEWVSFTTEVKFTIDFTPAISYIGSDINATSAKPYFKSNSFLDDFYYEYMQGSDLVAEWEVKDSLGNVVWTTSNQVDILQVQVSEVMQSSETYTIRVRYSSERFFGVSDWSNVLSFTPDWSIRTPTVTTPYDVTEYPVDGLFESDDFLGVNEEHFGTLWEIRKVSDDTVQHSSYNSFTALYEWMVSFGERDSLQEYYIVAKHLGRYGESDWSSPLFFTMQEIIEVNIYVTSVDQSVRRVNSEGGLVWLNNDHTDITNAVGVDQNRNAYSVSNDNTLKKINEFGVTQWSYTHDAAITAVSVYDEDNIVIGTADNLVIRLDGDANELWIFEGHTGTINSVKLATDLFVYSGSSDNTVRKLDRNGIEVWSFTGHTNNVNSVDVDVDGNVYSGASDNTVRKISDRGAQLWSFTGHSNNVNAVSVNSNYNIFSGSSDSTVKMIDMNGSQVWSFNFGSVVTGVDSDYLNRSYVGGVDDTVRMLNDAGEEVWVYNGNVGDITDVTINEIPILMKPIELTGRYWNLVPPLDLQAF